MRFPFLIAAVLALAGVGQVRADEPTKYYLEDGKVVAKRLADLERRVADLERQLAEARTAKKAPCICGDSCKCDPADCPARCPTAKAAAKPEPVATVRTLREVYPGHY